MMSNIDLIIQIKEEVDRISEIIVPQAPKISFFSEINLSPEDMQFVIDNSKYILRKMSESDDFLIVASWLLVHIGTTSYENNYWPQVCETTGYTISQNERYDVIIPSFEKCLDLLGLEYVTAERHIESILVHTLAPDLFLDDFFEFIYKYYEKVLSCDLPDENELKELADYVRLFNEKGDYSEYKEQGFPIPYSLPACTRYALMNEKLSSPLIHKILLIIDGEYWGKNSLDLDLHRYNEKFEQWFKRHLEFKPKRSFEREMQKRKTRMFLKGENVFVRIAETDCNEKRPVLKIIGDDGCIKAKKDATAISIGKKYKTYPEEFDLTKYDLSPLDSFKIMLDGKLIFKNETKMVAFFDEEGSYTKNPTVGRNYIYSKEPPRLIIGDSQIYGGFCNVYSVDFEVGDALQIRDKTFPVRPPDISKNDIFIEEMPDTIAYGPDGELSITRKNRFSVAIQGRQHNDEVILEVGRRGKHYLHKRVCLNEDNAAKEDDSFFFSIDDLMEANVPGEYHVKLKIKDTGICEKRFLYIPNCGVKFNTYEGVGFYYKRSEGIVSATGMLPPEQRFNTAEDTVKWKSKINEKEYLVETKIPSLFISFSLGKWLNPSQYETTIGRFLIGDRIRIKLPLMEGVSLQINDKELPLVSRDREEYVFDLSDWVREVEKSTAEQHILKINIGGKLIDLTQIITSNEYDVITEKDKLYVKMIERIEKSEAKFTIKTGIPGEDQEGPLYPGDNVIDLKKSYRWYTLVISEMESTATGESWRTVHNEFFNSGPELDFKIENGICTVLYRNNELILKSDPKNNAELYQEYDFNRDFSPWSKTSVRDEIILKLIPKIVNKAKSNEMN